METSLFYLLRVSIAAAILYLFFKFILSKRTFHAINRIVVLSIVVMTLILPLFTKTISRQIPRSKTAFQYPLYLRARFGRKRVSGSRKLWNNLPLFSHCSGNRIPKPDIEKRDKEILQQFVSECGQFIY